ncbi:MAG: sodium:proton antiporter NhaD [Sphingomonadales bacterium]
MRSVVLLLGALFLAAMPDSAWASEGGPLILHQTASAMGFLALGTFGVAYALVMVEEFTHLRKSKPVILAAGIIWLLAALTAGQMPEVANDAVEGAFRHTFLEFAELFCFLLVAMTYINSMTERGVFEALRAWLVARGFGYRKVFWITGILAFFISPIADNLTTALLVCAVVMAVGVGSPKFVALACINIVVAANAGGAFSPFGDITTLMVWQKGIVSFQTFLVLFVPSVVNYVVPAAIMHFAVPDGDPESHGELVPMKVGAKRIIALFLLTITVTVSGHQLYHMPPVFGMMTGLSFLQIFGFYLKKVEHRRADVDGIGQVVAFDVFRRVAQAEWDTLLFFYGVLMCVGGLAMFGYMAEISAVMYGDWGATNANIMVGILSAIVDNIPVMFAVLTMHPDMSQGQWLLVTLTAGVGGSMLSIGSAAGVALMGQARGVYTFFSHLKWTWAIALGYAASIAVHMWVNSGRF